MWYAVDFIEDGDRDFVFFGEGADPGEGVGGVGVGGGHLDI